MIERDPLCWVEVCQVGQNQLNGLQNEVTVPKIPAGL